MRISDWSSDVCSSDLLALDIGIHCFNIESEYELELVDATARLMNKRARIALRVNPDVDAKTPPYISTGLKNNKFGVDIASAERLYRRTATMDRSEEHTSELQSIMRLSYAVFCLKNKKKCTHKCKT